MTPPGDGGGRVEHVHVEHVHVAVAVAFWTGVLIGLGSFGLGDVAARVGGIRTIVLTVAALTVATMILRSPRVSGPRLVLVVVAGGVGCLLGWRAETRYESDILALSSPSQVATIRAQLVSDPETWGGFTTSAVVRLEDGRRVDLRAYGPDGRHLRARTFGDRVVLSGSLSSVDGQPWLKARHIVGRMSVANVELLSGPPWFLLPAAEVRDLIDVGARYLPGQQRALYRGLVTGDDRAQGTGERAVFRAAGLTHLVAVSGQNVAFVLLIARPLIRSLPYRLRLLFVAVVLGLFLVVTRMEPSVLRAVGCAMLATWASLTGRGRSGISVLAVVTTALLVIDPFLAVVVAFQLSVVASLGILLLTPILVDRLPGPRLITEPLAVTVGAQLAVAPLLFAYFDELPLASIPANLAVGWAAGAVMMLGLTVGVAAGLLGRLRGLEVLADPVAELLQLPAELLLHWISWSARTAVAFPLPVIGWRAAVGLSLLALASIVRPRHGRSGFAGAVGVLACLAILVVSNVDRSPATVSELTPGCFLLPESRAMILMDPCNESVVETVVRARVTQIDVVIVEGGRRQELVVAGLREVASVDTVLAPPLHNLIDARRILAPVEIASPDCGSRGGVDRCVMAIGLEPDENRRRLQINVECREENGDVSWPCLEVTPADAP